MLAQRFRAVSRAGFVTRWTCEACEAVTFTGEAPPDPANWRVWYRLALAYDAAGDRTRARAAVRHALTLF